MARVIKQDDTLRNEFLKRIKAKVASEKEEMKDKIEEKVPSFLSSIIKPVFGVAFDINRGLDKFTGNIGETNVAIKLRLLLSDEWVVMNDVIVEPEPEVFAQTDHVLIGPPGLFIIETKFWEGAFSGYRDKWKRKVGNQWVECKSPTKQNYRHIILIRKWLEGTGLIKVDYPSSQWINGSVILMSDWCKATNCCMPVFDGPLNYIRYLKELKERRLNQEQIEKITSLLAYPEMAKYFIDKQMKLQQDEVAKAKEQVSCAKTENNKKESVVAENGPLIEEGKSKSGKAFVRVNGTKEQTEEVRNQYLRAGRNPGFINKDKFKSGVFYFYLN